MSNPKNATFWIRRGFVLLSTPLFAAVVSGCSSRTSHGVETTLNAGDAAPIAPARCSATTRFGTPSLVPGLKDASNSLGGFRLSSDYKTAYYTEAVPRQKPYALHATSFVPDAGPGGALAIFGADVNVAGSDEVDPTVSGDGQLLVFVRGTPPWTDSSLGLFAATRSSTAYPFVSQGALGNLNVNTLSTGTPFLVEDGSALYFYAYVGPPTYFDIYRAPRDGTAAFGSQVAVSAVNSANNDFAPVVTPDELTIYWATNRADNNPQGGYDIWAATRLSTIDPFALPRPIVELNSPEDDIPTFVTRDGCTLYFSSGRPIPLAPPMSASAVYTATKPM